MTPQFKKGDCFVSKQLTWLIVITEVSILKKNLEHPIEYTTISYKICCDNVIASNFDITYDWLYEDFISEYFIPCDPKIIEKIRKILEFACASAQTIIEGIKNESKI